MARIKTPTYLVKGYKKVKASKQDGSLWVLIEWQGRYKDSWEPVTNCHEWQKDKQLQSLIAAMKEQTYEVEKLLDVRMHGKEVQYSTHWKGYPKSQATWEPEAPLPDECVSEFWAAKRKEIVDSKIAKRKTAESGSETQYLVQVCCVAMGLYRHTS